MPSYTKIGPSVRIKKDVAPVKILVTSKGTGNAFYRTYYAGSKKHREYKAQKLREMLMGTARPKYLQYIDRSKSIMSSGRIKAKFQKNIGTSWAINHAEAAGVVHGYLNRTGRLQPIKIQKVVRDFQKEVVRFTDGGTISTSLNMKNNETGGTEITYKSLYNSGGATASAFLQGTAHKVGEQAREFTITEVHGYKKDELGAFIANASHKFSKINVDTRSLIGKPEVAQSLIQLGMFPSSTKYSEKRFEGFKSEYQKAIGASKLPTLQKNTLRTLLKESPSFQNFILGTLRAGYVGNMPSPLKNIVNHFIAVDKPKLLTYDNSAAQTNSSRAMHTTLLQRDYANDYHKGQVLTSANENAQVVRKKFVKAKPASEKQQEKNPTPTPKVSPGKKLTFPIL